MKTENFSEHLVSLQPELLCFALKLTADKNDAKDLLQATSLKALDNESRFTNDYNFRGWVYTIMRNLFINNYRKVIKEQTFLDKSDDTQFLISNTKSTDELYESSYDIKEMYRIINTFPKETRVPFSMYVSGFKYREIADKLNLPIGTVKSRIFVTRQKLQELLKEYK